MRVDGSRLDWRSCEADKNKKQTPLQAASAANATS